jgi:hypothetical protein
VDTTRRVRGPAALDAATTIRRRRNRSILRDLVILLVVIVGLGLAWSVREGPNEELPRAAEVTRRMDAVFHAVRAGDLTIDTTPRVVAPGVTGAMFARRIRSDRWVLAGAGGTDCYVLWWDVEGVRRMRTLPATMPCAPTTDAMSPRPETYDRVGPVLRDPDALNTWAGILPDPVQLRVWFLPTLIVGGGIGLAAGVRMSIALLTGDAPSATRR